MFPPQVGAMLTCLGRHDHVGVSAQVCQHFFKLSMFSYYKLQFHSFNRDNQHHPRFHPGQILQVKRRAIEWTALCSLSSAIFSSFQQVITIARTVYINIFILICPICHCCSIHHVPNYPNLHQALGVLLVWSRGLPLLFLSPLRLAEKRYQHQTWNYCSSPQNIKYQKYQL